MSLNSTQTLAVTHYSGPMLVLAGPGSGKTTVITERTRYLIEHYHVNPSSILVITFTKAAATEMKQRFSDITKQTYPQVNFGTFHAIFFTILRYAYHYTADQVISDEKRNLFFRDLISRLDLDIEEESDFISSMISEISLVKSERLDLENYYSMNCSEEIFKKIYQSYEQFLRSSRLIDFDDMLSLCYELLTARTDILQLWQQRFQYILIDEFQDINSMQYSIIRLLSAPENNLFIVGDDDQSIYHFRGAKPEIMLNFKKDYPSAKEVLLGTNYRSTPQIIAASLRLISHNTHRFSKKIEPSLPNGAPVHIKEFEHLKSENETILKELQLYHNHGVSWSKIAILFRTNTQPRALSEKLMEYNLPFCMKESMPNLYDHWITRNIITYIRIALGNCDRGLFLQIANRPNRYIHRDCFSKPTVSFDDMLWFYEDKRWMQERIQQMEYDISLLANMSPYAAIQYIRKGIGYDEYLVSYAELRRMKAEELFDILDELSEGSRAFSDFDTWFEHIQNYSDQLKKQQKSTREQHADCITLSTMHAAKGLEYDIVYLIDANEGITPHKKAVIPSDIEEERRMFYVAMTRAGKQLHIYYSKESYNKELLPSRFVLELTDGETF